MRLYIGIDAEENAEQSALKIHERNQRAAKYTCNMSTALKQIFEQVHKLSRAEQLLLLSSIAQLLSEKEAEQMPDGDIVQSVLFRKPFITEGDKSIDPTGLFGIWKGKRRNIREIRQKGWKRD